MNNNEELVKKIKYNVEKLTYTDKINVYNHFWDTCYFMTDKLNTKLKLIGLVCLVTHKMRLKDPSITSLEVLKKIVGSEYQNNTTYGLFIEGLSIICENMMYGCQEFDSFGLKTAQEIINQIKAILEEWMPF